VIEVYQENRYQETEEHCVFGKQDQIQAEFPEQSNQNQGCYNFNQQVVNVDFRPAILTFTLEQNITQDGNVQIYRQGFSAIGTTRGRQNN
jgi:hypothetical protein